MNKTKIKYLKEIGAISNEKLIEKRLGKKGTKKRDRFEEEARREIVGEILKQARLDSEMTQEELATILGVGKATISKIERNKKIQRIDTIYKFVEALNGKISIKITLPRKRKELKMEF